MTTDTMEREQITLAQFKARLQAQGVPLEHCAFRCVRCGHIQSAASLVRYLPPEEAGNAAYYSCEGRYNKDVGCDWTLGGLFQIHTLEVLAKDTNSPVYGILRAVPVFEPASPEDARAHMARNLGTMRKCRVCGCNDFHACPGGCSWVEDDLCSACAVKKEDGHDPR